MDAGFAIDGAVLLGGLILLVGMIAGDVASRLRIPGLLLFLGLGMAIADDGLALVRFDDARLAQNVATVALVVILFEGGLGTAPDAFRRAGLPAGLLATVGVLVTAGVVAVVSFLVADLDATTAALLGAVVASTDAAAVFAALRTEALPTRTERILRLESGMNDPVAVLLTIGVVETWRADPGPLDWVTFLLSQSAGGLVVGLGVGVIGRRILDGAKGGAVSSPGVTTLAVAALSYGVAAAVGGSGFLAVYLTGVVMAGRRRSARSVLHFHEGLAATAEAVLFLLLGILVFPSHLVEYLGLSLVIAATLVFVARPLAVFAVLTWFRTPVRHMTVISWAGLRGAVPVVLATIPTTAGHPDGELIFDVAFVVVVASVIVQGPTVGALARRLGVVDLRPPTTRPEVVPVDAFESDLVEVVVPRGSRLDGRPLRDRPLPGGSRVVVVRRGDHTIVPDGGSVLEADDVLLVLTDRATELAEIERWSAVGGDG